MKSVLSHAVILLIVFACAPVIAAGPFGLSMGMTIDQIDPNAVEIGPGKYKIISVPKPHSAFEFYVVQVGPTMGLSWIKAVGKDISTSAYGIELRSAFTDMEAKLTKVYGTGNRTDYLLPDSIWDEPNDWMMSLIQKERYLMTLWDADSGATLKNDLAMVGVLASPNSTTEGYISVEYYFTNNDASEAEAEELEDAGL